jgi:hypothetical protein
MTKPKDTFLIDTENHLKKVATNETRIVIANLRYYC